MALSNTDLAKAVFKAFAERDGDALVELSDARVQLIPVTAQLVGVRHPRWEVEHYWGHRGARRFLKDTDDAWHRLEYAPSGYEEISDCLLVPGHLRGAGKTYRQTEQEVWWLFRMRDGKLLYWAAFPTRELAEEMAEGNGR